MADMVKVLDLVNSARAAQGLGPISVLPRGILEDPKQCPLARALNGGITSVESDVIVLGDLSDEVVDKLIYAWGLEEDYKDVPREEISCLEIPTPLAEFIEEFDGGGHPELEEHEETVKV